MSRFRRSVLVPPAWAALLALAVPSAARAHYIWVAVEPAESPAAWTLRAMFNEPPLPDGAFTKYVRDVRLTVDGQEVPSAMTEESRDGRWVGRPPLMVDAERDLGVMARGEKPFRLIYTARAQTATVAPDAKEAGKQLRVRLIDAEGGAKVQVLFDGVPVAGARIRVYLDEGEPTETAADDQGLAAIDGLAAGRAAIWANRVDPTPGEVDGKPYDETRHYATFTYTPAPAEAADATAFAVLPAPAVNSFGGAVLDDWLYVYSGHVGRTHRYSVDTTAKHFRRLNLKDRTTWEDLPMGPDLQGVALVADGRYLYRIGGMAARNRAGEDHDLVSVADFARFDPASKIWEDLPPLPEPRSTHDAALIGRTIYVAGGWTMKGVEEESTFPETALAFDLDRPAAGWKAFPQPFRRRALSVGTQGGRLYVLGGLVGDAMKVDRRVDVFDPASGAWSRGPDLPGAGRTEAFGTSAFPVDGRLYYSGSSGRIFRLSDDGGDWEAVGQWAHPRLTHRLLAGPGHRLLAVGGNAKGSQTPVIEAVPLLAYPREVAPSGD